MADYILKENVFIKPCYVYNRQRKTLKDMMAETISTHVGN